MGVTGTRKRVSGAAETLVARVRASGVDVPVCVGLGVSNGDQQPRWPPSRTGSSSGRPSSGGCSIAGSGRLAAVGELARDLAEGVRR